MTTTTTMFDKLSTVDSRYEELERRLSDPNVAANHQEYARLAKERAGLQALVERYREWRRLQREWEECQAIAHGEDTELRDLAKAELPALEQRVRELEQELRHLLLPKDPNDERNVVLEIRAGAGGDEASLFAEELFRMYQRYAQRRGWKVEILSSSPSEIGGFKEIIALIQGTGAYSRLKYEGGVHRVQRVPRTEAAGRIHTSTVTVAVLPEAEEVDIAIDPKDLRIDVFRASGPGGQGVNTTDSAVRITHLPTGMVVTCQDERSQHKNKAKAMQILRARLLERTGAEQRAALAQERQAMVGSGERAEKIRTYNFPENRVTDHRIKLTIHALDRILDGDLDPIVDALLTHYQAQALHEDAVP